MRNKILLGKLVIAVFSAWAFAVSAMAGQYGTYTYTDNGTDITITKCSGGIRTAAIPETIAGKPVTGIGDYAFDGYGYDYPETVIIPASITSIGDFAFCYSYNLNSIQVDALNPAYSSVNGVLYNKDQTTLIRYPMNKGSYGFSIPASVTSIGRYAFAYCQEIQYITIPVGVTSIGERAFSGCSWRLSSIQVDALNPAYSSVDGVLYNKDQTTLIQYPIGKSGTSYAVPDGVTAISDYALEGCGLTSISIPASVISIGEGVFSGLSVYASIELDALNPAYSSVGGVLFNKDQTILIRCPRNYGGSYTVPDGVTTISSYAFEHCQRLTGITIPSSVTSIGKRAFSYCTALTVITIPANVTSLDRSSFSGCGNISSISVDPLNSSYSSSDGVLFNKDMTTLIRCPAGKTGSYIIPSCTTRIQGSAFFDCNKLTGITMPSGVTDIEDNAFNHCDALAQVKLPNTITNIGNNAFSYCFRLTAINFPGSLTDIGSSAFYSCRSLSGNIIIPEGVKNIGGQAFYDCSKLTSVSIPDSVTSIGNNLFGYCSSLVSVKIGNGVTRLESGQFQLCQNLTSVTIGSGVTDIEDGLFSACSRLSSITVATANPSYGSLNGILFNKELTSLILFPPAKGGSYIIPGNVTSIADYAFSGCTKLTGITIPGSVTSIGDYAFRGCEKLTKITIPYGVTSIGNYAFSGCSNLISITMPNSITNIGDYALSDCAKLTCITFPESVASLGERVLSGCGKLTSVTLPAGTTSIEDKAFYNCSDLSSIVIPDTVTSIGNEAFYGCSSLVSISFPGSVTEIGYDAFKGCASLSSITLPGTVTSIGSEAFYGCTSLSSIVISDNVTSIWNRTFDGCRKLTSITIGAGVTSIEDDAFYGCTSLASITVDELNPSYSSLDGVLFSKDQKTLIAYPEGKTKTYVIPSGVTSIQYGAFKNCRSLTSITIPDSITEIGYGTFQGCTGLASVTIPGNVTSIGDYAFSGCSSLSSIEIPGSVTKIGDYAFSGCTSLVSITIPGKVTEIGYYAFRDCTNLLSVTFPASITSIDFDPFYNCPALSRAIFLGNAPSIDSELFATCASNFTVYHLKGASGFTSPTWNGHPTALLSHTVTFTAGPHGHIAGTEKQAVTYGMDCTKIEAVPDAGYHFTEWTGGGYEGAENPLTVSDVTSDLRINANFARNTVTLELLPTGAGEGSFKTTFVNPVGTETEIRVEAVPFLNSHFARWSTDDWINVKISNYFSTTTTVKLTGKHGSTLNLYADFEFNANPTKVPPAPVISATDGTYDDRIVITWEPVPGAIEYEFTRKITNSTPGLEEDLYCSTTDTMYEDYIDAGTKYYYFVRARNSNGWGEFSAGNLGYAAGIPAAPVLSASDGTFDDKVVITWKPLTSTTSYEVYRNTLNVTTDGDFSSLGVVSDCIFEDNTAEAGITYYYFAMARNSNGCSELSAGDSGYLMKAPSTPGTVTASDGKYFDRIRVSWGKVAGATSYLVFRTESETSVPDPLKDIPLEKTTALFLDDFGDDIVPMDGANAKKYYYWLAARNANGTTLISKSNAGFLSNKGPSSVKASNGTYSKKVVVTWNAVPGATGYDVYRYSDSKFTKLENDFGVGGVANAGASLEYEDSSPVHNGELPYRYYKVKAKYGARYESSLSTTGAAGMLEKEGLNPLAANIINGTTSPNIVDRTKGSILYFSTEVPLETIRLVVTLNGTSSQMSNDCDLFAKFANYPTKSSYGAKGVENSTSEILTVSNPSPGTWYFMLYGVTDYSDVNLTVNCYSATDIVLTQIPENDLPVPFKAVFKGKVVDESGIGIPDMVLQVRNPITGLTSTLAKTDKQGVFSYTAIINSDGEHTFDFFFTDIPDIAKGTASHTVTTRKEYLTCDTFFNDVAYVPAEPVAVPLQEDIIGLQNFLNVRKGWTNGAIVSAYESMWVEDTLVNAKYDAQIAEKLNEGLYLLLYGVEGAGVGNDTTTTSALSTVPFMVHVKYSKRAAVLNVLINIGIISGAQKTDIENGRIGIIAVTSLCGTDEGLTPADISLPAQDQLEILTQLAAGYVRFVEDKTYSGVASKIFTVYPFSDRTINVVVTGFVK